jgi:transcriptional regulator with XRE-family HTH domain
MATETQLRSLAKEGRKGIADTLKRVRLQRDLSQQELGDMAGVDRKTINRIENGHYSPSVDTLIRLAESLNIPVKTFFA